MKLSHIYDFQTKAIHDLHQSVGIAQQTYLNSRKPQVISFTAPTGSGKTVMMTALMENIYFGAVYDNTIFSAEQNAIFIWLSDSPQLNEQSKLKVQLKSDKDLFNRCVSIENNSFDQEMLDDGYIYFLNTQKLSKTSNLTSTSDDRTYTIWQTLENTIKNKSDRLYCIIDEAHRGMQGRDAAIATTIMQKFIKGSAENELSPLPIVIGMSATIDRFNALVSQRSSMVQYVEVPIEAVRKSGLLKDKIVITHQGIERINSEMAVFQAATDAWKDKWDHWTQYCAEQHYAYVNPIFLIQVQNAPITSSRISDTDLDACLKTIEGRTGFNFKFGEVIHTFGQNATININGLDIKYEEPSKISDNKDIKVVFFKESLSTGWDCPRAEVMMSFRHVNDATYIAQLLGRMIRTPRHTHIDVDETLNDVQVFLPFFDKDTAKNVVDEMERTEGGKIPTDIEIQANGARKNIVLTANTMITKPFTDNLSLNTQNTTNTSISEISSGVSIVTEDQNEQVKSTEVINNLKQEPMQDNEQPKIFEQDFDREDIVKYINNLGVINYNVKNVQISKNYLVSLFKLGRCLSQTGLYVTAIEDIANDIVTHINQYINRIKGEGKYEELLGEIKQFKLSSQYFDVFGKSVDNYALHDICATTEADIERQFNLAESKLGREGIGNRYCKQFTDLSNINQYKSDVIIYASDDECYEQLISYAEKKYHALADEYRTKTIGLDEHYRKQYEDVVAAGDKISRYNFKLPMCLTTNYNEKGSVYTNHLYVSEEDGTARFILNTWEAGVIAEEEKRSDFICWLRNISRASWALKIPYKDGDNDKPAYPDFLIVRKGDANRKYIIDILEPHNPNLNDNIGKAKGLAKYANDNIVVDRVQFIREYRDATGKARYRRLDFSRSAVRDKMLRVTTDQDLANLFDTDGFYDTPYQDEA